jgi:hypothetical protein
MSWFVKKVRNLQSLLIKVMPTFKISTIKVGNMQDLHMFTKLSSTNILF